MYLKRLDFEDNPYMFENAQHRSEANDLITEHTEELFIHLAKVWLFPKFESENQLGW